jgi:flagella basal body P-ring formation protein FlgA
MSKRSSILRWQWLALFVLGTAAHASEAAAWDEAARALLIATLQRAHPHVVAWELQPLVGHRQRDKLLEETPLDVAIAKLGARSAVTVRWRDRPVAATVWYAVHGTRDVVVANRSAAAGRPLAAADGRLERRDVMPLACVPLLDATSLDEMRSRVPLREDSVICQEHIEPRPAVARGERVKVHSSVGRVRVTGTAIATQDGAIGELLQVRRPESRARFLARVIGPQEVAVDE